MFEYFYNPTEAMLNKTATFTAHDLKEIAKIASSIWDDDADIYDFLDSCGQPFWTINAGKNTIDLEVHTNCIGDDEDILTYYFKECVNKAVRYLLEMSFSKK